MGLVETKEAIDAAARAFPAWSRTTAKVIRFHFRNLAHKMLTYGMYLILATP